MDKVFLRFGVAICIILHNKHLQRLVFSFFSFGWNTILISEFLKYDKNCSGSQHLVQTIQSVKVVKNEATFKVRRAETTLKVF